MSQQEVSLVALTLKKKKLFLILRGKNIQTISLDKFLIKRKNYSTPEGINFRNL